MRPLLEKIPAAALAASLAFGLAACGQESAPRPLPGASPSASGVEPGPAITPNLLPAQGTTDPTMIAIYRETSQVIGRTTLCLVGDNPYFTVKDAFGGTRDQYSNNPPGSQQAEDAPVTVRAERIFDTDPRRGPLDQIWLVGATGLSEQTYKAEGLKVAGVQIDPPKGQTYRDAATFPQVKAPASRAGELATYTRLITAAAGGVTDYREVSMRLETDQGKETLWQASTSLADATPMTVDSMRVWQRDVYGVLRVLTTIDGGRCNSDPALPTGPAAIV